MEDAEDQAQQAAQAAQAKITKAEAIAAAQAANPGWNFSKSELDSENGTILYELKGTDVNGQKQNIHVNAMDGMFIIFYLSQGSERTTKLHQVPYDLHV